ncbi:5-formyltetrahydrofolate cyclo-ligase [Akkermansiaceae bacterium]|nr:5-formyltetrahydrofolate cyclo-ligase [Akkermansiaceae bacterium]
MGEWQVTNPDDLLACHLVGPFAKAYLKDRLREDLRRRVAEYPDGDDAAVVREIAAYLAERPALKVVAVFAALPGEVNLRALPGVIERVWVFPRVEGEELVFHEVGDFEKDLKKGKFGILEPKAKLRRVRIDEVDLFLCPGLGFDLKGGRIGRGKGFYDRMLERARPDAVKLGVCYGYQLVESIVMEEHDARMNGVIAG